MNAAANNEKKMVMLMPKEAMLVLRWEDKC